MEFGSVAIKPAIGMRNQFGLFPPGIGRKRGHSRQKHQHSDNQHAPGNAKQQPGQTVGAPKPVIVTSFSTRKTSIPPSSRMLMKMTRKDTTRRTLLSGDRMFQVDGKHMVVMQAQPKRSPPDDE